MTSTPARYRPTPADIALTVSTLAFLAAYAWPVLDPGLDRSWVALCRTVVWVTWAVLVAEFALRLLQAQDRRRFLLTHPLDVAVIVLPLLRPLRLLRLVTLLTAMDRMAGSSLRGRVGVYLAGSSALIVFVASLAELQAERGGHGPIQTYGDSLWWAVTTITTVGYGDMYPVTTTGRLVAVGLMFAGVAVLGLVTAGFASWLVQRVSEISDEEEAEAHRQDPTRADLDALRAEIAGLRAALSPREGDAGSGPPPPPARG